MENLKVKHVFFLFLLSAAVLLLGLISRFTILPFSGLFFILGAIINIIASVLGIWKYLTSSKMRELLKK